MSEVDRMVRRMILESFGVEKYMDEHMNSTRYLLRAMKYTAPNTSEKKLGSKDHTDKNIVTVLCQGIQGLEIQLKNGEWITAKTPFLNRLHWGFFLCMVKWQIAHSISSSDDERKRS
ncbi:hypothetical protein V6N13_015212 [Hibiscus sabdariffa]|uniref:Isopenicillin N synthase-like Fe(2+) 2OG dioxygenase domain-containing protein n=1 Tax=Hibiscus sabdariffa TaxID=183260 RepID=A0ABR2N6N0_9ROSI